MTKEILEKMNSDNLSKQIEGLDEGISVWSVFTDKLIELLNNSTDSLFIAERISAILELIFNKLNSTFDSTDNKNIKFQIALIFLTNNNLTKVPFLLKFANETDNASDATFCLIKLNNKGVAEAKTLAQKWIHKLEKTDLISDPIKKKDIIEALEDIR